MPNIPFLSPVTASMCRHTSHISVHSHMMHACFSTCVQIFSNPNFHRGMISFAGAGPNTRGTDVFITFMTGNANGTPRAPWETPFGIIDEEGTLYTVVYTVLRHVALLSYYDPTERSSLFTRVILSYPLASRCIYCIGIVIQHSNPNNLHNLNRQDSKPSRHFIQSMVTSSHLVATPQSSGWATSPLPRRILCWTTSARAALSTQPPHPLRLSPQPTPTHRHHGIAIRSQSNPNPNPLHRRRTRSRGDCAL